MLVEVWLVCLAAKGYCNRSVKSTCGGDILTIELSAMPTWSCQRCRYGAVGDADIEPSAMPIWSCRRCQYRAVGDSDMEPSAMPI